MDKQDDANTAPAREQEQGANSASPTNSRRRQRRRSDTFTNVVGVQPHGPAPTSDTSAIQERRQDNSNGRRRSQNPREYYQIAGNGVNLIDEESNGNHGRHDSLSSVDTDDFYDHRRQPHSSGRQHQYLASAAGSSLPNNPRGGGNGNTYNSPSMMERWRMRKDRRGSSSRQPLLRGQSGQSRTGNYEAITDALNGADSFSITMDEEDQRFDGLDRFIDIQSDEEPPNSNPSSRRSSNASSLHDVCFPMEIPEDMGSLEGRSKIWPDLDILNEFAEQEAQEISATEQAIVNDVTGERTHSLTSEGHSNSQQQLNEQDLQGRLRPQRIVPWVQRGKERKRKEKNKRREMKVDEKAAQFRFTYFREDMEATTHSPNISGLLQPGQVFADLFPPRYAMDDDESSDMNGSQSRGSQPATRNNSSAAAAVVHTATPRGSQTPEMSAPPSPAPKDREEKPEREKQAKPPMGRKATGTPMQSQPASRQPTEMSFTPQAPFWLDVLNPTEEEMKVLSKTFGIHPLTTEDIFHGETREKVELFRNYYLVCFRSIDTNYEREQTREKREREVRQQAGASSGSRGQGPAAGNKNELRQRRGTSSESASLRKRARSKARQNDLKALNMYIVVFHEGVITFHFAPTTHPINVRRRARLLQDYITVSSDWVSYALIDDITDGFAPLIEAIEDEVNSIEDAILRMHSGDDSDSSDDDDDGESGGGGGGNDDDDTIAENKDRAKDGSSSSSTSSSGSTKVWREKGDMLRRIGECRKRVMSLLRLLGSKADVIKGFSKRCNEQWEVAPRSEIALFLGDIQDHIVTMVQSLNHYEKLLARSHSNYLAQINIDMTRVNNDMNDVLGRITVLGTIVLPMNIVTGLWGMNVLVPGQDTPNLIWFWSITGALVVFAGLCFVLARRVYKI